MSRESQKRWAAKVGPEHVRKMNTDAQRKKRGCQLPTRPEPKVCECCKGLPTRNGRLHADHEHPTGKFRGWLCNGCNTGIGLLGDNLTGAQNAERYLTRASAVTYLPPNISPNPENVGT
jgi:hypothetical protein